MPNVRHAARYIDQTDSANSSGQAIWLEKLARICYVAKGSMFLLIGLVAALMAISSGGAESPPVDVLQVVTSRLVGRLLLALIVVCSLCVLVWRVLQAVFDTECKGADPIGLVQRFGFLVSAAAYGGFAFVVARLAFGFQLRRNNGTGVTANVMTIPIGQVLIALVGVGVLAVSGYQIFRAVTCQFEEQFDMPNDAVPHRFVRVSGIVGLIAHGIMLGGIGLFLVIAALQQQIEPAQGLGDAFQALSEQPGGPYLLGMLALCSCFYGLFLFVEARYRIVIG